MRTLVKAVLAIMLMFGTYHSGAQVFVKVRPQRPHYDHWAAPSHKHIWIDEDWEARGNDYVFVGGRWAEPPRDNDVWIAGHWRRRHHEWVWIPGHWR
jgi:hypothetical protein